MNCEAILLMLSTECPGPEWVKLSTACYYAHNKAGISYYDALDFCHKKQPGAYLAMVETPREQKQLAKYLQGITMDGEKQSLVKLP